MSDEKRGGRSLNQVKRHDEALEVLLILRRRLLDRMARVIVENREKLLNGTSRTNNPLASNADLAEMIRNLAEIDRAVAGLADMGHARGDEAVATALDSKNGNGDYGIFSRFVELVRHTRLEEASQELSRTFQMALDRVTTATRFFSRTLKADETLPTQLARFSAAVTELSEADATKALMRLFGFQAVEARMAIQALLSKHAAAGVR